jgi:hypothetical protein
MACSRHEKLRRVQEQEDDPSHPLLCPSARLNRGIAHHKPEMYGPESVRAPLMVCRVIC